MKSPGFKAVLLLASLASGALAGAQTAAPPSAKAPKSALEKDMDTMGWAMRRLKNQIADPSRNASSLDFAAQLEAAARAASTETPEKAEDVPPADRDRFVQDFREDMGRLVRRIQAMEAALKAGDNPGAALAYRQLLQAERQGHREFRKPPPNQGK